MSADLSLKAKLTPRPPNADFGESSAWAHQAIDLASPRGWMDSPRLAYAYLLASWTAFQTGDVSSQTRYAELGQQALDGVNNVEVEVGVRSMHALARFEAATGTEALERFEERRRKLQA